MPVLHLIRSGLSIVASAALIASVSQAEGSSDDPLSVLRGSAEQGPPYAFDISYELDGDTVSGWVDPTRPKGKQVTIVSPSPENRPKGFEDDLEALELDDPGDIWCDRYLKRIPTDAQKTADTGNTVIYTFSPVPDPDADGTRKKVFSALVATAVFDKADPAVLSYQMHLPERLKLNLVARLNTFSLFAECARSPDGRTYVADLDIHVEGSALGRPFKKRTRRQITRLFAPGNPA